MFTTAQPNLLLRAPREFPIGLQLPTEEFHDDWNFARSMNIHRLESKIQGCGWNFIKIADGAITSGVGDTSQQAIASALRIALCRISEYSNVVEVTHVELTQYPWFFIARVGVCPYRIQQDADLPATVADLLPMASLRRRSLRPSATYYPLSVSAVPMLKAMLALSSNMDERAQ